MDGRKEVEMGTGVEVKSSPVDGNQFESVLWSRLLDRKLSIPRQLHLPHLPKLPEMLSRIKDVIWIGEVNGFGLET